MATYGDYRYQEQPFVMPGKPSASPRAMEPRPVPVPHTLTPEEQQLSRAESRKAKQAPKVPKKQRVEQNGKASSYRNISEAETRYLIDQQLRQVGWEVDSREMTYAKGTRPARNHNRAIAEWPTDAFHKTEQDPRKQGRADYALFVGKQLVGIIEAKRRFKNVSSVLDDQCREYATHIRDKDREYLVGQWGDYQVPLLFAANGRPFIRQCRMASGIWFRDVRKPDNAPKALLGWMSPDGVKTLLERDIPEENRALEALDMVGLSDRVNHLPNQMSGGQQQRVAIARALVNDPVIILADEATGNLDTRTSYEIMMIFQKLHRQGKTIAFVTHEPDIATFSERTITLRDGLVKKDETHEMQDAKAAFDALPPPETYD